LPNEQVLSEKKRVVEDLTKKLGSAAGVLVDYSGITVAEDTEMRAKMRELGVDYSVVKNTLMRFAIKNAGLDDLDPLLNGTTSLAVHATDVVAPAKIIKEYAGKITDRFKIKGGFYDGHVISIEEIESLASIPPLPQLQAQLLGTMLAPISQLALVIKLIAEKDGEIVEAKAEVVASETAADASAAAETAPAETPSADAVAVEAPSEAAAEEPAGVTPEVSPEAPVTDAASE